MKTLPLESACSWGLLDAVRDGETVIVQELLEAGVSAEHGQRSGYTALGLATNRGYLQIVELLLASGASANTPICPNGATPLMIAAVWNRLDIAEVLLESGASLDAEGVGGSYRGKTPIEIARERDRPAMAELLCAHRARRRLARLAPLVLMAGRFARALRDLHTEIRFRPGGRGMEEAKEEFVAAASAVERSEEPP